MATSRPMQANERSITMIIQKDLIDIIMSNRAMMTILPLPLFIFQLLKHCNICTRS